MSKLNILNISETTKGGIETFMNSLRASEYVNNDFLLPDFTYSICQFNRTSRRLLNLLYLLHYIFKVDLKKYDFIFLHSTFAGLLRPMFYFLSFFYNFKVVYCSHGWSWDIYGKSFLYKFLYIFIEFILSFFCHGITCVSNYDLLSATKYKIRNVTVIQNGVRDTSSDSLLKKNTFSANFLFVGRLDKQKGLFEFLDSINLIDVPYKINLKVIGVPVVNDDVNLEFFKNNIFENINIEFIGWVNNEDLDPYYFEADITIVPSLYEAFGLVVIESIRNSTPVLVTNKGALPLLVNDNIGWVYELGNLESLKETLYRINCDSIVSRNSKCREVFLNLYHQDIMNKEFFNFFKSLSI